MARMAAGALVAWSALAAAWPRFTPGQMADLIAYLNSLQEWWPPDAFRLAQFGSGTRGNRSNWLST